MAAVFADEDDGSIEVGLWCDLGADRPDLPVVLRAGREVLVESTEPDLVVLVLDVSERFPDWPAVAIDGALHPVATEPGWRLVLAVPEAAPSTPSA